MKRLLDREEFSHRPVWFVADEYDVESDKLVVRKSGECRPIWPLEDPDLFLSFAKLWARGEPSQRSILNWVGKHGLLMLEDETQPLVSADRQLNQAAMALEEFKAEALRARSALDLYADLYEGGGIAALKERIRALRADYLRVGRPLSELDKYFVNRWGEVPDESGWNDGTLLWAAAMHLQGFVQSRVANVRLGFSGELVPWVPSRGYKPVQSWHCPDWLSAIYLQFYFWMTDALPMRRCINPACEMPFPATRSNKRVCSRSCRSNLRHYPHLQRRR